MFMLDVERRQDYLTGLGVVALALVIVWRSFLRQSLWLDESLSFWVVQGGLKDVVYRATNFQGQSPFYYVVLWYTKKWLGATELALRVPSVLAVTLSAIVLYSLGKRWFSKQAALLSLAFFLSLDTVLRAMCARPYALALLFALFSVWTLWRWLERGGFWYWLTYIVSTILAFYAHYLFFGIIIIHLTCVLIYRPTLSYRRLMWLSFAWSWVALFVMAAWPQLNLLWERKAELFFAKDSSFKNLVFAFMPLGTLVYLIGGLLTAIVFFYRSPKSALSWKMPSRIEQVVVVVLLAWYLCPPILFYLFSRAGFAPPFVDRYYLWYSPALALLCAVLIQGIEPVKARLVAIGMVFAMMLIREVDRRWEVEDWRAAAQIAREEVVKNQVPVLLYSGLVEAEEVKWLKDSVYQSYLAAPLSYYQVPFKPLLLSSRLAEEGQKRYFESRILSELQTQDSFLFVFLRRKVLGLRGTAVFASDIYGPLFDAYGFKGEELIKTGPVRVWRFKRVGA